MSSGEKAKIKVEKNNYHISNHGILQLAWSGTFVVSCFLIVCTTILEPCLQWQQVKHVAKGNLKSPASNSCDGCKQAANTSSSLRPKDPTGQSTHSLVPAFLGFLKTYCLESSGTLLTIQKWGRKTNPMSPPVLLRILHLILAKRQSNDRWENNH
jgi:hypothetical protein